MEEANSLRNRLLPFFGFKKVIVVVVVLFLRLTPLFSDLAELNLPKTCQMDFPDPNDLLNFKLVIMPDEVFILTIIITSTFGMS